MAILTYIDNTPLYSTVNEALSWGEQNGLTGYHVHKYKDVAGYMGGYTHIKTSKTSQLTSKRSTPSRVARSAQAPRPVQQPMQQQSTYTPPSTGGGGY